MSPELVMAISAFVASLVSLIAHLRASKFQAKKDEVSLLREEVERLHGRLVDCEKNYKIAQKHNNDLIEYIGVLRKSLIQNGIEIPQIPKSLEWLC